MKLYDIIFHNNYDQTMSNRVKPQLKHETISSNHVDK